MEGVEGAKRVGRFEASILESDAGSLIFFVEDDDEGVEAVFLEWRGVDLVEDGEVEVCDVVFVSEELDACGSCVEDENLCFLGVLTDLREEDVYGAARAPSGPPLRLCLSGVDDV